MESTDKTVGRYIMLLSKATSNERCNEILASFQELYPQCKGEFDYLLKTYTYIARHKQWI